MGDEDLTFRTIRVANRRRPQPACADWKLSAWSNAVLGELGEAANLIKKIERGDFPLADVQKDLAREFADVLTYLDVLADHAGIDLAEAYTAKFNEISDLIGSPVRIRGDEVHG